MGSLLSSLLILSSLPVAASDIDFDTQVIPLLTRAGCNSGACHGAAIGRGGFALSLYGGNPQADYQAIVHALEGRRINLSQPDQSLLILKPTESLPHGGGTRLEWEGPAAELLENWIRAGAARLNRRQLLDLELEPRRQVTGLNEPVQLQSTAVWSDGSREDVTRWTVFEAEDPQAVALDRETHLARVTRRGRHIVIARFLQHVVPLELLVPMDEAEIDFAAAARGNWIDDAVYERLATLRIPASAVADDAQFLRRLHLDLTGRLPTPARVRAFLRDADPHKRERLVDELLASDAFIDYWSFQLARWFRLRPQGAGRGKDLTAAVVYQAWLRDGLRQRRGYDELVRTALTSSGDTHHEGPPNVLRTGSGPRELAEFVSELFMGSRLRCANCHNHPLDRWTQDDYHGLAAVFARLERGRVVRPTERGQVSHPRTGEAARPRLPGGSYLDTGADPRTEFARWLTQEDNPYFARAFVNRVWKAMLGRGLVEPVDDLRDTNPPTHPELLTRLAEHFVANRYDLRATLRLIATSAAYARSSRPLPDNAHDLAFYSHALTRPLPAEVVADAIADATGIAATYAGFPTGTRAITLPDPTLEAPSLDILGRCDRSSGCDADSSSAGGLSRQLHLLNGPLLNDKITSSQGRLSGWLQSDRSDAEIVQLCYLHTLSRLPPADELTHWKRECAAAGEAGRESFFHDLFWSLLASRSFSTNH